MLYQIKEEKILLEESKPLKLEKQLQSLLMESGETDGTLQSPKYLREDIFGTKLLIIGKEVYTKDKKRSDILCLDENGDAVIIEIKKEYARLGIETQALQYLADVSSYVGKDFVERYKNDYEFSDLFEEHICSFLGWSEISENLNRNQAIFLVANDFDKVVYSIGDWLFSKNVSFKCLSYYTYEINNRQFIDFTIKFEKTIARSNYLDFTQKSKKRRNIFYFNIGIKEQLKWERMIRENFISCGFDGVKGDRGYKILNSFYPGDKLVCYLSGKGVVGICEIPHDSFENKNIQETENKHYSFSDETLDSWGSFHKHKLRINWLRYVESIDNAIKSNVLKDRFNLYHPIQTLQAFPNEKAYKTIFDEFEILTRQ
ncbi:hypothetical protein ND861_04880 [Leptospira sp. 2 VSF19]|uniref:DUF91 domain-containing protein n=1 Tax=Leptospira soteropolitanensis TaxID=2950025 RepID=A0AAW5VKS4_9LEPT|nr:hypothetical protein [Leptospira soteropolitanensis]MCW7491985.1 hypothetical protein [Leptospira soteropolitanensis]MCW7499568.1 hypothetical protein [Leptospira soteropolitanensis]MCW7521819.1 hypothetical protein [Leptospira soteropolitanensis]MCW7525672.1 hypothetical protein [Leptospira soteropolitanensis]MCW7530213.1 hypothetical protein [Leptospira soteropolitanensis]